MAESNGSASDDDKGSDAANPPSAIPDPPLTTREDADHNAPVNVKRL
jgi:hypothetical protein